MLEGSTPQFLDPRGGCMLGFGAMVDSKIHFQMGSGIIIQVVNEIELKA